MPEGGIMTIVTVVTMVSNEAEVEAGNCGPVVVAASGVDLDAGEFGVLQVYPAAVNYESLEPDPDPDPDPETP